MNVVNYTNFIRVLIEEVKVCCCLRSSKEPSFLVRDNWEFFIIQEGHFKGTPACRLNPDHAGQKNKAITMANHTVNDTLKNVQHLPILKTNKKFDTYTMIHRQLFDFLPSDEQIIGPARMFRKEASPKQQKVSLLYIYICCCLLCYCLCLSFIIINCVHSHLSSHSPHLYIDLEEGTGTGLSMESKSKQEHGYWGKHV
jgi:hypothetical protein